VPGILEPQGAEQPELRPHDIQPLTPVLAEPVRVPRFDLTLIRGDNRLVCAAWYPPWSAPRLQDPRKSGFVQRLGWLGLAQTVKLNNAATNIA
jgi:hypothetical protein